MSWEEGFDLPSKMVKLVFSIMMLFVMFIQPIEISAEVQTLQIHVSLLGNESNDGTMESPLNNINDALRIAKKEIKKRNVEIVLHEGDYHVDQVHMNNFKASEGNTLTITGADNEYVNLTNALTLDISDFEKVTDKETLARIDKKAKNHMLKLDLSKYGFTEEMLTLTPRSWKVPMYSLYVNHKEQKLSHYPYIGYKKIGDNFHKSEIEVNGKNTACATVFLNDTTIEGWDLSSAYVNSQMAASWHEEYIPVIDYDAESFTVQEVPYGIKSDGLWNLQNILEAVDMPGKWCIEPSNTALYYYPTSDFKNGANVQISLSDKSLFWLEECSNIAFKNLDISNLHEYAFLIYGCENIVIDNCDFRNFDYRTIIINHSTLHDVSNIKIINSKFYNAADEFIYIPQEGNRKELVNGNILIENNIMYNPVDNTLNPHAYVRFDSDSLGVVIKNNTMAGSANALICYGGNNNLISGNELYNAVRNSKDAGVIYLGRDMAAYGNIVRHNYIHDYGNDDRKEKLYYMSAYFLDDLASGQTCEYNIFAANNSYTDVNGFVNGGGQDNKFIGNIVMNAEMGYSIEDRSYSQQSDIKNNENYSKFFDSSMFYYNDIWESKYPQVSRLLEELEEGTGYYYPKRVVVKDNVYVNVDKKHIMDTYAQRGNNEIENCLEDVKDTYPTDVFLDGTSVGLSGVQGDVGNLKGKVFSTLYPKERTLFNEDEEIYIHWETASFADKYEYIIATDLDFKNVVDKGETLYTYHKLSGQLESGVYYWKVKAINYALNESLNDEWYNDNGIMKFFVDGDNISTYKELNLTAPENKQIFSSDDTITFLWTTSKLADYYIFELATDNNFGNIVKTEICTSTNFTLENLEDGSTYYWRVKAINNSSDSGCSIVEEPYHFTVIGTHKTTYVDSNTKNVIVRGTDAKADSDVVICIKNKMGSLVHIDQFPADENGNYYAKFKLSDNVDLSECSLKVISGKNVITDSVLEYKESLPQRIIEFKPHGGVLNIKDIISQNVYFENLYGDVLEYTIYIAYYDEKGRLKNISTKDGIMDFGKYDSETYTSEEIKIEEEIKYVKSFIWVRNKMIPLTENVTYTVLTD